MCLYVSSIYPSTVKACFLRYILSLCYMVHNMLTPIRGGREPSWWCRYCLASAFGSLLSLTIHWIYELRPFCSIRANRYVCGLYITPTGIYGTTWGLCLTWFPLRYMYLHFLYDDRLQTMGGWPRHPGPYFPHWMPSVIPCVLSVFSLLRYLSIGPKGISPPIIYSKQIKFIFSYFIIMKIFSS